ncbi:MAG TPA: hypothetical protein VIV14_01510, partial [Gammaproteobacteria bacterium]
GELKRRKIFQVTAIYLVTAWLILQVADVVSEPLLLPDWFPRMVIVLLAIGFPVTVILSWAFDVTPAGVVRDDGTAVVTSGGGRIEHALIGLLIAAVGFMFVDGYLLRDEPPTSVAADTGNDAVPAAPIEAPPDVLANSVAVLPFENLSVDPEDAYFAIGIHDELLNQLAKIQDLKVIARTSVLQYAGAERPIEEIAGELNVETVMEGSVRYADGQVRITAQLNDGRTGTHIWSETYTRPFENIFEIETAIAAEIAAALEAEFSPAERQSIVDQAGASSPEAFAVYVRAIDLWQSTGPIPEVLTQVEADLERVIALDPGFAQPYAVLADIYSERLFLDIGTTENWRTRRVQLENQAIAYAEAALERDPNIGYAYAALGKTHQWNWREQPARQAFERALELSPNDPEVLIEVAWFSSYAGEHERAIGLGARSIELDPGNSDLWNRYDMNLLMAGDLRAALVAGKQAVSLNAANPFAQIFHGVGLAAAGDRAQALTALRAAEQLIGDTQAGLLLGQLAMGYAVAMSPEDAGRIFSRLEAAARERRIGPGTWALAFLAIGDEASALEQLELAAADKSADDGTMLTGLIKQNVYLSSAVEQPEFVEVRARLGYGD